MAKWKSIESAPTDGTIVLVYGEWAGEVCGPMGGWQVGIAKFSGEGDYEGYSWRAVNTDASAAWWKPTHWQNLPNPPSVLGSS
jgi:hypothetical protein